MTTSLVETFEQSLAELPITFNRTDTNGFNEALELVLDSPAVGVPLPFDDISLSDHPVTIDPTSAELLEASIGVTPGGPAIADYGSIVVTSDFEGTEHTSLYPDTHVIVLASSDIVSTLADAVLDLSEAVTDGLTSAVIATGPSATADMGAPVYGAHGPESVHVILINDK